MKDDQEQNKVNVDERERQEIIGRCRISSFPLVDQIRKSSLSLFLSETITTRTTANCLSRSLK
jgi:hypothetical protein